MKLPYDNILAISASAGPCSLVLKTANASHAWESSDLNQHSEQILPAISGLLERAGLQKPDLIAVDIGPGAFTSVRVACGIAQGLALGWGCKVQAVESTSALAYQALAMGKQDRSVLCVLDARMGECYVARFDVDSNGVLQRTAPHLLSYAALADLAIESGCSMIGNSSAVIPQWEQLSSDVRTAVPSAQGVLDFVFNNPPNALDPEALQPLYVRNQVALTRDERAAANAP